MNNSARKDEIAKGVQRQIKEAVEAWLATGEFDLHERVHGIILQALTSYEEERTPSGEGWQQAVREARAMLAEIGEWRESSFSAGARCFNMLHRLLDATPPASRGEGAKWVYSDNATCPHGRRGIDCDACRPGAC
jgi:hypothetical protein